MSTNWKPGDVAMVTFDNATGNERDRGIRRIEQKLVMVSRHSGGLRFVIGATERIPVGLATDAQRLAVVNPEDVMSVGDLTDRILDALDGTTGRGRMRRAVTQAIRETADPTPPKPDEPTGLGAVVEDEGEEWVHFGNGCWIKAVPNANLRQKSWEDFPNDVKVLSLGRPS